MIKSDFHRIIPPKIIEKITVIRLVAKNIEMEWGGFY